MKVEVSLVPAGFPVPAQTVSMDAGRTVEEMALAGYGSLDGIQAWIRVADGNALYREIPRNQWRHVRVKRDGVLTFSYRPQGGKNGNLFATVAMIALTIIAPYAVAAIGGASFAIGTLGNALVSTAILTGASYGMQKLFPATVPGIKPPEQDSAAFSDVTAEGNALARGAYLPIVCGERVIVPPDVAQPRAYLQDGKQMIDRCLALYGEHALSEVRIDGVLAETNPAITVETRSGAEGAGVYTFVDKISTTTGIGHQLTTFSVSGADLEDQDTPANSEPQAHYFTTPYHEDLEEIAIRLRVDGFIKTDNEDAFVRIPYRIRFREKGTEVWRVLPEMHMIGQSPQAFVRDIRIRWDTGFAADEFDSEIYWEFWKEVPEATEALSDGSTGPQWVADPYFSNGAGYKDVVHATSARYGVRIRLSEEEFPKAGYEWEIIRGIASRDTQLDDNYEIGGNCYSLFRAHDDGNVWKIPVKQGVYPAQVSVVHATAIADRHPVEYPHTAIIALRSKGQSVRTVTVKAARAVLDWNGSAWATKTTASKNPATHYRHLVYEYCIEYGIDTAVIDEAAFVAWRQECLVRGYECSSVFAGESLVDSLMALAISGFAVPVFGMQFSVDFFRDRSADIPVQVFSPRNVASISCDITQPERPFGYRVAFENRDDEWKQDEIEVRIDNSVDLGVFEAASYKAIDRADLAERRGYFDLLQATERRRTWTVECALEGVLAKPGEMASLITDLLDDHSHGARVREVVSADVLRIDQVIPTEATAASIDAAETAASLFSAGEQSIIFVSTKSGVEVRSIIAASGGTVTLDSPLSDTDNLVGAPVNITTLSNVSHRAIVTAIQPQGEERAIVTLVDEAPQIWAEMKRKFKYS